MAGKVFISYRHEDDPSAAARVRDALAASFGKTNIFMDVDSLLAGQRFDEELSKALATCDVLIVIMGLRWMDLLKSKNVMSGARDYVRVEIAQALKRKIVVVPVRVGREGQLPPLPRAKDLPADISDLVQFQMHDVLHEHFGRDIAELVKDITQVRRFRRPESKFSRVPWSWISATAAGALAISLLFHASGLPRLWTPQATASDIETQPDSPGLENRGWLGVKIQNIDKDTAASLGLSEPKGALVTEVRTPGPAAERA